LYERKEKKRKKKKKKYMEIFAAQGVCTIGIKDTGSNAPGVNDACGKHVVVSTTLVVIKGTVA
jgi:hypothetical protein